MSEHKRFTLAQLAEFKPLQLFKDSKLDYWLKINSDQYLSLHFNHFGDGLQMIGYRRFEDSDATAMTKRNLIPLTSAQRRKILERPQK